jgi:hypothetical protein
MTIINRVTSAELSTKYKAVHSAKSQMVYKGIKVFMLTGFMSQGYTELTHLHVSVKQEMLSLKNTCGEGYSSAWQHTSSLDWGTVHKLLWTALHNTTYMELGS